MNTMIKKLAMLLSAGIFCLLLSGCGEPAVRNVEFSFGPIPEDQTELVTDALVPEDIPLLDGLGQLRRADFRGSSCYEEIAAWGGEHPGIELYYTVPLPGGGAVDSDVSSLDLSGLSYEQMSQIKALAKYLPELDTVELGGSLAPEEVGSFLSALPELSFQYSLDLAGGTVRQNTAELDLSGCGHRDIDSILECLPLLPKLRSAELGGDTAEDPFTWDDIYAMEEASPQCSFNYSFSLYGRSFTLADAEMNFSHVSMEDAGAQVLAAARCMRDLKVLDMDSCGVPDEDMAAIRDALPDANVVWRIWFGEAYSVRTDVEMILASNPGLGGELTPENTVALRYCTKVKYLDLGHNSYLGSLEFASYMPDLEVLIAAISNIHDLSPLADCPKLEYLEVQTSGVNNVSPLAGLKNLRHLNLGWCFALHDISPLYGLQLDRLWIGLYTPVPEEQIEEFHRQAPDCEIDVKTTDPTGGTWRYTGYTDEDGHLILSDRYRLLKEQFVYSQHAYAYYWNDPLYYS